MSKSSKKERKRAKAEAKASNKNQKHNNSVNSLLSNDNKAKPIKVKKFYTWSDIDKLSFEQEQNLTQIFIERAERAQSIYNFMPFPVIPMKIKGVKRPVPIWYNDQIQRWQLPRKAILDAANLQRRKHHEKIRHLEGFTKYIQDVYSGVGGNNNTYDPEIHIPRLKEIAKKVDFVDHWAKHLGISIKTLKAWKDAYPEFGRVYRKYKGKQTRNIEKSIIKDIQNGYDKEWTDDKTGRKKAGCSPQEKAKILSLIKKSQRWDDSQSRLDVEAKLSNVTLNPDAFKHKDAKKDTCTEEDIFNVSA